MTYSSCTDLNIVKQRPQQRLYELEATWSTEMLYSTSRCQNCM